MIPMTVARGLIEYTRVMRTLLECSSIRIDDGLDFTDDDDSDDVVYVLNAHGFDGPRRSRRPNRDSSRAGSGSVPSLSVR